MEVWEDRLVKDRADNARTVETLRFSVVERLGPITIVTLNRPESMNALHREPHDELAHVFDAFAADPDQWIAIVTGAGDRAFCAGNDLKVEAQGGDTSAPRSGFGGLTSRFDLNKPVIAAVNGFALGGGFEIALACDLIVASRNASFALPEPKVGLAAMAGGLHRLPRAIGLSRAMDLILTSRRISAEEAQQMGFVARVVETGEALSAALALAKAMCGSSPMALRASKEAVRTGSEQTLAEAIKAQWRYPAVVELLGSEDRYEGPRAFAEKRAPRWSGQ